MVHLDRSMRLLFDALSAAATVTGRWRHPRNTTGDLPTMTLLDKVHWLHKARNPVVSPERGQDPADFRLSPQEAAALLPPRFEPRERIRLVAAGDLMPHPWLSRSTRLYDAVADIMSGADWCSANLEAPVSAGPQNRAIGTLERAPSLGFDRDQLQRALQFPQGGFHHLSLANNHILDGGSEGLDTTLNALDELGIGSLGVERAGSVTGGSAVFTIGGVTVAAIAVSFGLNGNVLPGDGGRLVHHTNLNDHLEKVDLSLVRRLVETCRQSGSELIVAHLHWGLEFELFPTRKQQRVARALCDLGLDLIVSHHPHVIQPIELYHPRGDPERVTPICYSLGNTFSPYTAPIFRLGLLVEAVVARGVLDGRECSLIERITPHPVFLSDGTDRASITLQPLRQVRDVAARASSQRYLHLVLGDEWAEMG
jgi:poly-gamma-glutamate synthesis protein (capsule biosynthesis protein)